MRIKSHAPIMYLGMAAAGIGTLGLIGTYAYLMGPTVAPRYCSQSW